MWVAIPSPPGLVRRSANFQCLQDVVRLLGLDLRRPRRHRHDDSSNPTTKGLGSIQIGITGVGFGKHKNFHMFFPDAKKWSIFWMFFSNTNHENRDSGAWWNAMWLFFVDKATTNPWNPVIFVIVIIVLFEMDRNGSMDWYTHQLQERPQKTFKCFISNNHIWTKVTGPSHLAKTFMEFFHTKLLRVWTFGHFLIQSPEAVDLPIAFVRLDPRRSPAKNEDNDVKGCLHVYRQAEAEISGTLGFSFAAKTKQTQAFFVEIKKHHLPNLQKTFVTWKVWVMSVPRKVYLLSRVLVYHCHHHVSNATLNIYHPKTQIESR